MRINDVAISQMNLKLFKEASVSLIQADNSLVFRIIRVKD